VNTQAPGTRGAATASGRAQPRSSTARLAWTAAAAAWAACAGGAWEADAQTITDPGLPAGLPTPANGVGGGTRGVGGNLGVGATPAPGVGGGGGGGGGGNATSVGPNVDLGDQQDYTHQIRPRGGAVAGGGIGSPEFTILPRVSISESYNDNIFLTPDHRKSDFITYLTPGVSVFGTTPNVQVSLDYAPTFAAYASHGNQDFIAQDLNGQILATLVPDLFYLNLRGYGAVTPTLGGVPTAGGGFAAPSQNSGFGASGVGSGAFGGQGKQSLTQTLDFSATPYLVHRFGDWGTGKIGYTYDVTNTSGRGVNQNGFVNPNNVNATGTNTDTLGNGTLTTNQETIQFDSGPAFGRVKDQVLATASQYGGTGVVRGAYQNIFSNTTGYALTRFVTVFGQLGYEDIHYGGTTPVRISEPTWAFGTTLTPNPDSSITVGYGHKNGTSSAFLDGSYMLTARTRLSAQYFTGLGSDLQQTQNAVASSVVDDFGNAVDYNTGAPVFITDGARATNGNNSVYRSKNFVASASTLLDVDTLTLSASYQTQSQLTSTVAGTGGDTESLSLSFGWTHQLDTDTQTNLSFGGGTQKLGSRFITVNQTAPANESFFTAQLAASRQLSETLSANAQYTYFDRSSDFPGRSYNQNVFLVGLTKRF
jgi:uncharacterized protein (PEP-CTERM system associated)